MCADKKNVDLTARKSSSFKDSLRELIDQLPLETIDYAFAYGSGAIEQRGERREEKAVDFILATRDTLAFHTANLARNRRHYSALRWAGAANIATLQTNCAARLYFNTLVRSRDGRRTFKYGVISVDDLRADLLDWRWLYAAGRLHKPVIDVLGPPPAAATEDLAGGSSGDESMAALQHAILENRRSALHAALLLLPDSFSHEQLFQCIVSLSYNGDFRMKFGEDRSKIEKIVSGAMSELTEVYSPLLAEDPRVVTAADGSGRIEQDASTPAVYHRLNLLPSAVLDGLCRFERRINYRARDVEEVLFSMAHRHDVAERVADALVEIVRPAAWRQTLINGLSAGVMKSLIYSSSKIFKMIKSLR